MLTSLRTWWPVAFVVLLMLAVIDGTLSSLLTCHPVSAQTGSGAYSKPSQEECTALRGPILISLTWLLTGLHKYEGAVVALFTVILAVFTGRLWFSTDKLWEATKKLAEDAERTAQNQSADTRILQRAYIAVDCAGVGASSDRNKCHPNISIRNAGNLPARGIRWVIHTDIDKERYRTNLPVDMSKLSGNITLPPRGEMVQGGEVITVGQGPNELHQEAGLYLYIWGPSSTTTALETNEAPIFVTGIT